MTISLIPPITPLPKNLPLDGAIATTLQDGVMLFRAVKREHPDVAVSNNNKLL